MASLSIECTNNKVIKILKINGESFHTETIKTELGSSCKLSFEDQFDQIHPGWTDIDEVYEAIREIDDEDTSADIMYALTDLEKHLEESMI